MLALIFSAAYVGLVIGYLINNNEDYECRVCLDTEASIILLQH